MFRARVPLRQGKQDVEVVVRDIQGRVKPAKKTFLRDSTRPPIRPKGALWGTQP
jgi:hypothetical protein